MSLAVGASTSLGSAVNRHLTILIIDAAVLIVLCGIHTVVWCNLDTSGITDDAGAASRLQSATTGALTVAGILVPLTIVAISAESAKMTIPNGVLVDFFVANVWFFISIVAGLLVLYLSFYDKKILSSRPINIFAGYQLFFLLVGGFQLVWAFGGLVQSFLQ